MKPPIASFLFLTAFLAASAPTRAEGVAVLELYTSEGCSSCPPADKLVGAVNAQAVAAKDDKTICLAWHVDYWDGIGWPDPWSNAASSERQRVACQALQSESVYTPQTIVNGATGFVGSDQEKTRTAIAAAKAATPDYTVTVSATRSADGASVIVDWKAKLNDAAATPKTKAPAVDIVLTEDGLLSNVTRGENAGKVLQHDAVVRSLTTVQLNAQGSGRNTISLPQNFKASHGNAIAIVRGPDGVKVLGAGKATIGSTQPATTPAAAAPKQAK